MWCGGNIVFEIVGRRPKITKGVFFGRQPGCTLYSSPDSYRDAGCRFHPCREGFHNNPY